MPLLFCASAILGGLTSCSSAKQIPRPLDFPFSEVYPGTFETVWNATVRVLDIYSITVASRESGVLQTELSNFRFNTDLYANPDQDNLLEEVRYRLKIKLSKGVIPQTGEPAVRVQIVKAVEQYRNIFTDWERVPSDELEERVILYRIRQRLRIADTIRRKAAMGSKAAIPN